MAERQSSFALDIGKWCEQAKENADQVVRGVSIELLNRVVLRSPVGNPELWAANKDVIEGRARYNADVDAVNSFIASNPATMKYGKLKKQRRLSAKTIAKRLPLKVGKGYTGGRFRGNWIVTIGARATGPIDRIDPGGAQTIAAGSNILAGAKAGPTIWLTNNVPYSVKLEYGHSTQAPTGVVRVTAVEFQAIVNEQVRALPQ